MSLKSSKVATRLNRMMPAVLAWAIILSVTGAFYVFVYTYFKLISPHFQKANKIQHSEIYRAIFHARPRLDHHWGDCNVVCVEQFFHGHNHGPGHDIDECWCFFKCSVSNQSYNKMCYKQQIPTSKLRIFAPLCTKTWRLRVWTYG